MERKTAKDLRAELKTLEDNIQGLKKRISNRLRELCKANPEVPVARHTDMDKTIIKAKSVCDYFINQGDTEVQLRYIEIIEKYLEDLHPHKQTKINF
jgi:DNA polymerase elongation subunit (family B)